MADRTVLVDTSVIIEHFRKKNKENSTLYHLSDDYNVSISVITAFELRIGAITQESQNYLSQMLAMFEVIDLNAEMINLAADIYKSLKQKNELIDMNDIFIAATAIFNDLPLSTLNKKHFLRIEQLEMI